MGAAAGAAAGRGTVSGTLIPPAAAAPGAAESAPLPVARINIHRAHEVAENVSRVTGVDEFIRAGVFDPRREGRSAPAFLVRAVRGGQAPASWASFVTVFQFRIVTTTPSRRSQSTLLNVAFRIPLGHHRYR